MKFVIRPKPRWVIGPDDSPLTIAGLPAPGTKRWGNRRKAEVVAAVRGGLLSLGDACDRYMLTFEEYLSWQSCIDRHGLVGLGAKCIQRYRKKLGADQRQPLVTLNERQSDGVGNAL